MISTPLKEDTFKVVLTDLTYYSLDMRLRLTYTEENDKKLSGRKFTNESRLRYNSRFMLLSDAGSSKDESLGTASTAWDGIGGRRPSTGRLGL